MLKMDTNVYLNNVLVFFLTPEKYMPRRLGTRRIAASRQPSGCRRQRFYDRHKSLNHIHIHSQGYTPTLHIGGMSQKSQFIFRLNHN